MPRTFGPDDAKRFYDRFGAKQDLQFYENAALDRLVAHADFEHASSVFELGCGTGRFAERLLRERLPPDARYVGVDVSSTMVRLARRRLAPWAERAAVREEDASKGLADADGAFDRFVVAYVLDLLSEPVMRDVLVEARRVLAPGGALCVVALTEGRGAVSRAVCATWNRLYALAPSLVGGCRPVRVREHLDPEAWTVAHWEVVSMWGVPSEVLVARRVSDR